MYATISDLKIRISDYELVSITASPDSDVMDVVIIDSAIEMACIEIDGYLASRFDLPLATAPAILTKLAADLAVRNLYLRSPGGVPESHATMASSAEKMLIKIAAGTIDLDIPKDADESETEIVNDEISIDSSPRIFSRTKMQGF